MIADLDINIGRRLRVSRDGRGLSARVAARLLGCSYQWLGELERGKRKASIAWLMRLGDLYGVSIDWIVRGDRGK